MQDQRESTKSVASASGEKSVVDITPVQEDYIAFVALGGLIPSDTSISGYTKMTTTDFALQVGVERTTLYLWRRSIPDFWDRVNAKRKELSSKDRLSAVWNSVFLKAIAGGERAQTVYLANHDPDFRMPMQQVKHEAGDSWADVMTQMRKRQAESAAPLPEKSEPIEGEVVNDHVDNLHPESGAQRQPGDGKM